MVVAPWMRPVLADWHEPCWIFVCVHGKWGGVAAATALGPFISVTVGRGVWYVSPPRLMDRKYSPRNNNICRMYILNARSAFLVRFSQNLKCDWILMDGKVWIRDACSERGLSLICHVLSGTRTWDRKSAGQGHQSAMSRFPGNNNPGKINERRSELERYKGRRSEINQLTSFWQNSETLCAHCVQRPRCLTSAAGDCGV